MSNDDDKDGYTQETLPRLKCKFKGAKAILGALGLLVLCAVAIFCRATPNVPTKQLNKPIQGQDESAIKQGSVISTEPQRGPEQTWEKVLWDGIHKKPGAAEGLENYIASHPNEKAPLAQALLDSTLLSLDKREQYARQLLALAPGDVLATQVLADILLHTGKINEAIQLMKASYETGGFTDYFSMLRSDYVNAAVAAGIDRTEALASYQFSSKNTSIVQTNSLLNSTRGPAGSRKLGTAEQRNTITALLLDIVQRGLDSGKLDMISETRSQMYAREILYNEVGQNNAAFSNYLNNSSLQAAAKQAAEEAGKGEALWFFSSQQDRTALFGRFSSEMKVQFAEILESDGEVAAWRTMVLANPALFREQQPVGVVNLNWPADFDRAVRKLR